MCSQAITRLQEERDEQEEQHQQLDVRQLLLDADLKKVLHSSTASHRVGVLCVCVCAQAQSAECACAEPLCQLLCSHREY